MVEEKAPEARAGEDIKAYDIHLERQKNEDRILAERTSMFLVATSFLFAAFVILLDPQWEGRIFPLLRILLPSVGLFLTLLLLLFNIRAVKALARWHNAQGDIEGAAGAEVFKYMLDNKISPHYGYIMRKKEKERERKKKKPKGWLRKTLSNIRAVGPIVLRFLNTKVLSTRTTYWCYLPLAFFVLWGFSLFLVIVNPPTPPS